MRSQGILSEVSSMPLVTIKLARREKPLSTEKKEALISGVTRLLVESLDKRAQDVVVLIEELDPDNWGQGGQSATQLRKARSANPQ
jgi:4-oxalocrotonate tautomerase